MSRNLLLAMLTGFLLNFAYPPFKFSHAALVALVPFFYLIEKTDFRGAIAWAGLTGLLVCLSSVELTAVSTLWEALAILLISPAYFALYAAAHHLGWRKYGNRFLMFIPVVWACKEGLQYLGHLGFAANSLGATQTRSFLLFPRESSLAVLALSFWIVTINVTLYFFLKNMRNARRALWAAGFAVLMIFVPELIRLALPWTTYDSTVLVLQSSM